MRARTFSMSALGAALSALLACSGGLYGDCTLDARPGLLVTARDSVTGAPISDARVLARAATTADSSNAGVNGMYYLAHEEPGTYDVVVERTAYRPWSRANVRVTSDECHVRTVSLTALLQPQP